MRRITRATLTLALIPALTLGASTSLLAQEGEMDAAAATDDAAADHAEDVEAAASAALDWLAVLDTGDYGDSWDAAAGLIQEGITRDQWTSGLGQARGQFEPFGVRTRINAEYTTELPNAPAGEYVVLQYRSEVSGDRTVVETVVPMKQEDGSWKVSGYFVRP